MIELKNMRGQVLLRLDGVQVLNLIGQTIGRTDGNTLLNLQGQVLAVVEGAGIYDRKGILLLEVRAQMYSTPRGRSWLLSKRAGFRSGACWQLRFYYSVDCQIEHNAVVSSSSVAVTQQALFSRALPKEWYDETW